MTLALYNRSNRARWVLLAGLIVLLGGILAAAIVVANGPAGADHNPGAGAETTTHEVHPEVVPGNPSCTTIGSGGEFSFKIDSPGDGTFTAPNGTQFIIDVYNTGDGQAFDFEVVGGVAVDVIVKGGPNANHYEYEPPVVEDTFLHAPVNPQNNRFYGLSHIEFCYDEQAPDAFIEITPDDVNEVGEDHTFTVNVQVDEDINDASGFSDAPDGTHVDVTLTDSEGAASVVSSNTCDTNTGGAGTIDGECTITFSSDSVGNVTGNATVTVLGLTRSTDGTGNNSGPAVKHFVDASVIIEADDTNEVGDPHTFFITVTVDAPSGVKVDHINITPTGDTGAIVASSSTCVDDSTSDATGCQLTVNSQTAGSASIGADVSVQFSDDSSSATETVNRSTDDSTTASGLVNSGDATKTWVDASISIDPDGDNPVNEPHTFTVTVLQDDGSGPVAATVGHVDLTLTNSDGADAVVSAATCHTAVDADPAAPHDDDNLDGFGQCSATFTSSTTGTVTGHAEVTLVVGGLTLTRSTDGIAPNSDDAVKTFDDGAIRINKDSSKGGAVSNAGAVFSVEGPSPSTDSFNVTDNGALDEDDTIGRVCVSGLEPGTYIVNETTPPSGYGDASETDLEATAAVGTDCDTNQPSGTGVATFVNPPLYDIQVNFRDAGSGETSIVSIECVGTGVNSTSLDGAAVTGWDASQTTADIEFVDEGGGEMTLECTLVVDP